MTTISIAIGAAACLIFGGMLLGAYLESREKANKPTQPAPGTHDLYFTKHYVAEFQPERDGRRQWTVYYLPGMVSGRIVDGILVESRSFSVDTQEQAIQLMDRLEQSA